jgi:hypothetical protein
MTDDFKLKDQRLLRFCFFQLFLLRTWIFDVPDHILIISPVSWPLTGQSVREVWIFAAARRDPETGLLHNWRSFDWKARDSHAKYPNPYP